MYLSALSFSFSFPWRFSFWGIFRLWNDTNNNNLNTTDKSFAVAIVIASLAGPQWLLTEEKIRNPNFNGTINYNNAIDDGMYILKTTKSSLWILCFAQGNIPRFSLILHNFECDFTHASTAKIRTKQRIFVLTWIWVNSIEFLSYSDANTCGRIWRRYFVIRRFMSLNLRMPSTFIIEWNQWNSTESMYFAW